MKIIRCGWCEKDDLYRKYHDEEWGKLVEDDHILFEFLVLESFQAGLSWHTILKKRQNFRSAFDEYDYELISKYGEDKISELLLDAGIIRNKLKINSTVNNSSRFQDVQAEFGSFFNYLKSFFNELPLINHPDILPDVPATTDLSDQIAKDLKRRGFKFLGSTVVYAYLQATGFINDHLESCSFK